MRRIRSDAGAVAVEFAIVLIPLMIILMGTLDFGIALSHKLALSDAARVGARIIAVQNDPVFAHDEIVAIAGAAGMNEPKLDILPLPSCPAGVSTAAPITVTVTYPAESLTGMFDSGMFDLLSGWDITGKAVMRCGG